MKALQGGLPVTVKSVRQEAADILSYELRPIGAGSLPAFDAGAHIDIHLKNGLVRSYSLLNAPGEDLSRYVIAVHKNAAGRGGSTYIHETVRPGDLITISAPRNNFPLYEDAAHSVFIAGGIGITPLWSMIQRLEELGKAWEIFYCAKTGEHAAFATELRALEAAQAGRVHFNFDQEPGGKILDLTGVTEHFRDDVHLYCCGPAPMLAAFEAACTRRDPATVHLEYFAPRNEAATEGGFVVSLARSSKEFVIAPDKSILDTLLDAGIDVQFSCSEGICGVCETRVLDGIPDHRDMVLSPDQQASNNVMMICCSGSKTEKLVLDI